MINGMRMQKTKGNHCITEIIYISGDSNAKVGKGQDDEVIGKYCL